MTAQDVMEELGKYEDPSSAQFAARFFKTGPGEYGEGDVFIGLTVPQVRSVCKMYQKLSLPQIEQLLESEIHEHRLAAVIIMTEQAKCASEEDRKQLYELYLRRTDRINNWDLVDVSCREVVGGYLMERSRKPLYKLADSGSIWERRIAIVSTWQFIRVGQLADTFAIAELLLSDTHDLIHKAVGWMLREAGKKDEEALKNFLDQHAYHMPRTMLRYSIERLQPDERAFYMNMKGKQ